MELWMSSVSPLADKASNAHPDVKYSLSRLFSCIHRRSAFRFSLTPSTPNIIEPSHSGTTWLSLTGNALNFSRGFAIAIYKIQHTASVFSFSIRTLQYCMKHPLACRYRSRADCYVAPSEIS